MFVPARNRSPAALKLRWPELVPFALLCRPGFESDLIAELGAASSPQPGLVLCEHLPPFRDLVFARDAMEISRELPSLDARDRVTPIRGALAALAPLASVVVLHPDADSTRPLAPLAKALQTRLQDLQQPAGARGVVWLTASTSALVGIARGGVFPGGIPRLKFPPAAPSRSTLKLDEAIHVLLSVQDRERLFRPGMTAVDLGAAPGGWTFQLVQRGLNVVAVDNGRIDARLLASGKVEHRREDGFRFRAKKPVDWLVCDMVEQPSRVVALMVEWLSQGRCRGAIFNLKLPMKKRHAAWIEARKELLTLSKRGMRITAKQLYHDREEITVAVLPR